MRRLRSAVLLAGIVCLAACSSGAGTAATGGVTTALAGSATGPAPATTEFTGTGSGDFCKMAAEIQSSAALQEIFALRDPVQLESRWGDFLSALKAVTSTAPAEIRPDLETLTGGFERLGAALAGDGWDLTKAQGDPAVQAAMNTDEADAASGRIDRYVTSVCGIGSGP